MEGVKLLVLFMSMTSGAVSQDRPYRLSIQDMDTVYWLSFSPKEIVDLRIRLTSAPEVSPEAELAICDSLNQSLASDNYHLMADCISLRAQSRIDSSAMRDFRSDIVGLNGEKIELLNENRRLNKQVYRQQNVIIFGSVAIGAGAAIFGLMAR